MKDTPYELVNEAVRLGEPSRVPIIPIIGLYSLNISNLSSYELLHDGQKQARSQLACQTLYGYDGLFNIMDLTVEAQVLGAEVEFPPVAFPYLKSHPLKNPRKFEELPLLDVESTRLSVFIKSIELMASKIKEKLYLSSYVIGPFTLAGHLLGIDNLMELTLEDEKTAADLVAHCVKIIEPYVEAQVAAGTDAIVILEPSASSSLISPTFFKKFSYPNVKSLVSQIHSLGVGAILHICGKTLKILESMSDTGADVISIDSHVDISEAKKLIGGRVCLMGNVDTTLLVDGAPIDITQAVDACIAGAADGGGYILSTSCDMPIEVPRSNLAALVQICLDGLS
jgi:uroporphyrinogen decarboxylase